MKRRVENRRASAAKRVFLGTFHAFCAQLLTERNPELQHARKSGPLDSAAPQSAALELERYRQAGRAGPIPRRLRETFSRAARTNWFRRSDTSATSDELGGRYARERATLPKMSERLREEEIARQREIARAYRASDALLRESNRLTFGMQLLDAVRALDDDAELAREVARALPLHSGGRVSGHERRADRTAVAAGGRAPQHRRRGRHRQAIYRFRGASFGSFTIFLERFAGVAKRHRAGAAPFMQAAGGQLPLGGAHPARRKTASSSNSPLPGEKLKDCAKPRWWRKNKKARMRIVEMRLERGRGGALDRSGNRATARRGRALAQLRGAVPHSHASRAAGGGTRGARHSVRHPQPLDSEPSAGARLAGVSAADGDGRRTTWPARECSRRRLGDSQPAIWCGLASARRRAAGNRCGTRCKPRRASCRSPRAAPDRRSCGRNFNARRKLRKNARGGIPGVELLDEWLGHLRSGRVAGTDDRTLRGPPAQLRARMAAEERDLAAARARGIPRLFRAGRRADQSRTGTPETPCSS